MADLSDTFKEVLGIVEQIPEGIQRLKENPQELTSSKAKVILGQPLPKGIPSDVEGDIYTEQELAKLPQAKLQTLREKYKGDAEKQELLAPFEHRATAREAVAEKPQEATIWAGALIPAYQAVKLTPSSKVLAATDQPTTPPSVDQYVEGMVGVYEGLSESFKKLIAE